ncbi:mitotic spindle assembly checkpoint protein MAD2A isoform X2 [Apis cerana]|uniref:mitotic spindle assembly checkpoint protein MAD2A isoform X2 n=1 Tax=Apis cerana TaxID=7461 RepID=UPI0007E2B598|nr:mitotic spindle assembly checkpoint protein MAD2A isoform X2 [Apis cerana]
MTETQQKTKCITLKGSAELVKEYLLYGVNSILYQRGIYPPETFEHAEHFGLFVLMSTDEKIKGFLNTVLGQIQEWLIQRKVQKITLVITNVNTKEVLEKWDFKVDYEGQTSNSTSNDNTNNSFPEVGTKDVKTIQKEIREVIRQITEWDETQPVFIANSQEVQLRSFSTSLHKMDTIVSYKNV